MCLFRLTIVINKTDDHCGLHRIFEYLDIIIDIVYVNVRINSNY